MLLNITWDQTITLKTTEEIKLTEQIRVYSFIQLKQHVDILSPDIALMPGCMYKVEIKETSKYYFKRENQDNLNVPSAMVNNF